MKNFILIATLFVTNVIFAETEEPSFSVSIETSFVDEMGFDQAIGLVASNNYNKFIQNEINNGNDQAMNISNLTKLESRYLSDNDLGTYRDLNLIEKATQLSQYASISSGIQIDRGVILNELVIREMINNPADWKTPLSEAREALSFHDKLLIASHFGGSFGNDYNYDRADTGPQSDGIVSIETMLINLSNSNPGGVCRDVTRAQSQILTELGVDKKYIYSMAYATANGHHAVTLVQDPKNNDGIYKINYDYLQYNSGLTGPAALKVDGTLADVGLTYRIYDADGSPVTHVPTEIGQIFREVTNSSRASIAPKYTINKTVISSRWVNATVFEGQNAGTLDSFYGLALDRSFHSHTRAQNMEIGVAIISREGNKRNDIELDQTALMARLKHWIEKKKTINRVVIKGILGSEIEVGFFDSKVVRLSDSYVREGNSIDVMTMAFAGLSAEYTSKDGKLNLTSSIMIDSYLDFKNITAASSGGVTLAMDAVRFDNKAIFKINEQTKLTGQVLITMKQIGNSVTFRTGLTHEKSRSALDFSYHTPIGYMPMFTEEFERTYTVGARKQIGGKKPKARVRGEIYFEGNHFEDSNRNRLDAGLKFRF